MGDEEAERYIKIFTDLPKDEIEALIEEHRQDPGRRVLQNVWAKKSRCSCTDKQTTKMAVEATNILFGKATKESLLKLDEETLLAVFDGVQKFEVNREQVVGAKAVDLLAETTKCFASKGEMRKLTQGGGVSLNKEKLEAFDREITADDLLDGKYLLAQKRQEELLSAHRSLNTILANARAARTKFATHHNSREKPRASPDYFCKFSSRRRQRLEKKIIIFARIIAGGLRPMRLCSH